MFEKTIRNHAERRAALEAAKREIAEAASKRRLALEHELRKSHDRERTELEAADAAERATVRQLHQELVDAAHKALGPLVAAFRAEPGRAVTVKLGQALEQLLQRERTELGGTNALPRSLRVLAFCFVDHEIEARPEAVKQFSHSVDALVSDMAAVHRAVGAPSELERALRGLEARVEERARVPISGAAEPALERYRLLRTLDAEDIAELDAERKAVKQAELARLPTQIIDERGQRHGSRVAS